MDVYIEEKHWNTIINYAKCAEDVLKSEIGGMAVVIEDKDGDWEITDPVIMKQEVTAGTCDLDKAELAKYYSKMEVKYKKNNMRFCWWHSHAAMSAFWSGTDIASIDEYKDGDLSFALVVNIKEEYKCRVSLWKPFELHQDVELEIINKKESKLPKKTVRDVAELCSKPTVNITGWKGSNVNQTNIWNKPVKAYNKHLNDTLSLPDQIGLEEDAMRNVIEQCWENLIDKVCELNSELSIGNIQYDKYAKEIKETNNELEKKNIPLKVRLLSKNTMEEVVHIMPEQLIKCTDGQYSNCDPSLLYGYGGYYG